MRKELTTQWELRKDALRNYFTTTNQDEYNSSYKEILVKIFELVLTEQKVQLDSITTIDNGDYQGTLLFTIPFDKYQPSEDEYYFTSVGYGSCSGCDTLQGISDYDGELPTEEQVDDYMTLALHMIQKMKKYSDFI